MLYSRVLLGIYFIYSSVYMSNPNLGQRRCRGNSEFRISRYKLLYIKQINNKVLLYSVGNYIQYLIK